MSEELKNVDMESFETNNFQYSAVRFEELGSDCYTIINVAVDTSYSVEDFKDGLEGVLTTIRDACKLHPKSENLLIRVVTFGLDKVVEVHGYTFANAIDTALYKINPNGCTPLRDAVGNVIESTESYAIDLEDKEYTNNAVFFIISDGLENNSQHIRSNAELKDKYKALKRSEKCESVQGFLIGVNDDECKGYLEDFQKEVGLDAYISIGDVTPSTLAKLTKWISQSISSQSSSIHGGGPSQPVDFNL